MLFPVGIFTARTIQNNSTFIHTWFFALPLGFFSLNK